MGLMRVLCGIAVGLCGFMLDACSVAVIFM